MYNFNVSISVDKKEMFDGLLTTPNKTTTYTQLPFVKDGTRKAYCTPINQLAIKKQSQRAVQTCWSPFDKDQYNLLTWLSGCPRGMGVFVEISQ